MKTIEGFLDQYSKQGTVKSYRAAVFAFLDHIYGKVRQGVRATQEERAKYEERNTQYFGEDRDYVQDLILFIASMDGRPPGTTKTEIAGIKEWLLFNGIELSQTDLRRVRSKLPSGNRGWTDEKDLDKDVLKKVLAHADEKLRTLLLTLASSGMRIGEALQIKLDDMDLSSDPPEINVRGEYTKSGNRRTVFISTEAGQAIEEWLKVRDSYLRSAVNRNKGLIEKGDAKPKNADDNRIFPFSDSNIRQMWMNTLRKTGLETKDSATGRLKYRIHGLRKFFRSQMALSCPVDIVEALMGHEGYLTDAYRRYTTKQMAEYYKKAEHHVTIFESGDLAEIRDSLKDTKIAMNGYKQNLEEKDEIITRLTGRLTELEKYRESDEWIDRIIEDRRLTDQIIMDLLTHDELKQYIKDEKYLRMDVEESE
ncbi:MAG: site-specific tyrosine recombinase XerC [Candidatus Syntrophoarchaeum sp. GoM_oil]|nr:MAG: site-specific tyrosine recombinase XerC [Candidatus Syntrophoarchaeum sp. GoM_oil]